MHVLKQSWHSSRSRLDFWLASASANAHRGLKAYSIWLENWGRGHQGRRMCSESPNASLSGLWVFTGNSLQFFWTFAPESLWMLFGPIEMELLIDVGIAITEVGGKRIAQSMCRPQLGCSTLPKRKIKLLVVRPPSSIMSGGRTCWIASL